MAPQKKLTLDIKTLIGLGKLSLAQVGKYMDHDNYLLKGSDIRIFGNSLEFELWNRFPNLPIKLAGINEQHTILFSVGESKEQTEFVLQSHLVLIIFKEGKAKYAVFSD
jgi:hypothetical protein